MTYPTRLWSLEQVEFILKTTFDLAVSIFLCARLRLNQNKIETILTRGALPIFYFISARIQLQEFRVQVSFSLEFLALVVNPAGR
jgi:hypothetical protein